MKIELKKNILGVIAFLFAVLTLNSASANTPLACQGDASAGLSWKNGSWNTTKFITEKFILVLNGTILTEESVAKAMDTLWVTCRIARESTVSCSDNYGGYIIFNTINMRGTLAKTFGGTLNTDIRDAVFVEAFSCQTF